MRNNQPITQQEYKLQDDDFLISRTDLKGRITYANPAFVEVSGFTYEELIGSHHNMVRHPDMPPAAFENFWETLAAGNSWHGLVKNRRKNGDHYWVDANVTPIIEDGEVMGYASVRIKASEAAIQRADDVYRKMRAGKGGYFRLNRGEIQRRGPLAALARINLGTLKSKITLMVSLSILLLVAAAGMGIFAQQTAAQQLEEMNRDGLEDVVRLQQIGQWINEAPQHMAGQDRIALMDNREAIIVGLDSSVARIQETWGDFMAREVNRGSQSLAFGESLDTYLQEGLMYMSSALAGEPFDAMMALNNDLDGVLDQAATLTVSVNAMIDEQRAEAGVMLAAAKESQEWMLMAQLVVLLVGIVLLVLFGAITLRAVLRPLGEAMTFSLQIAAGNLSARLPSCRRDEVGRLVGAMDIMRKSLGSIVGDVHGGIRVVTPAARDIAVGNDDLSSRTEQQAAALQETASSMEEMTTTVEQNTDNARQASGLATDNASRVRETGELMHEVVSTMGRITESSRKMTEIIDVIDAIAFQTNILALNASVEAARAGEQGRGFAVVAGEVRNLAGRSADAAKEIRGLIDGSSREIGAGAQVVHKAEGAIEQVVASATRVNDIMGEITSASEEQSSGIAQINQAIAEMDQVTQQNASRVQASARAASELEHQADQLAIAIAAFRLRGSGMEVTPDKKSGRQSDSAKPGALSPVAWQVSAPADKAPSRKVERQATADNEEWEAF